MRDRELSRASVRRGAVVSCVGIARHGRRCFCPRAKRIRKCSSERLTNVILPSPLKLLACPSFLLKWNISAVASDRVFVCVCVWRSPTAQTGSVSSLAHCRGQAGTRDTPHGSVIFFDCDREMQLPEKYTRHFGTSETLPGSRLFL